MVHYIIVGSFDNTLDVLVYAICVFSKECRYVVSQFMTTVSIHLSCYSLAAK